MTQMTEFDRRLGDWLDASGPASPPDGLLERAIEDARTRRQPRVWLPILQRDFPVQTTLRYSRAPALGYVALFVLIVLALIVGALAVGAFRRPPAPPFGNVTAGPLAFDTNGDIVVSDAHGTGRRNLTSGPDTDLTPIYSPDGTHIAFWRTDAKTQRIGLGIMAADGSDLRIVLMPASSTHSSPVPDEVWSPDSRHVAFALKAPQDRDDSVWTLDADGSNLRRFTPPGQFAGSPAWSSDGTRIASSAGNQLWTAGVDGSAPVLLATDGGGQTAWQPGGDRIAFLSGDNLHDVKVVRSDGSGEQAIAADPLEDEYTPAWSPDGSHLAFMRNVLDKEPHDGLPAYNVVVITDPDGANPLVLDPMAQSSRSTEMLDGGNLVWSPDGTSLAAFTFAPGNNDQDIIVFDAATGTKTTIVPVTQNAGLLGWQRLAP